MKWQPYFDTTYTILNYWPYLPFETLVLWEQHTLNMLYYVTLTCKFLQLLNFLRSFRSTRPAGRPASRTPPRRARRRTGLGATRTLPARTLVPGRALAFHGTPGLLPSRGGPLLPRPGGVPFRDFTLLLLLHFLFAGHLTHKTNLQYSQTRRESIPRV